ncbi:TniQ family protein [Photobacterium rosenbergii]|uniref:TniQ family protein n=1 Tax=Photobacterium rosenbergii TaxID=294936 RepID=UPI001C9951C0|nr:TniQ family protein [Photobacterium rosenbergii]MBY5946012.1 TniQ family protein [Photobacterium rosenbergii]
MELGVRDEHSLAVRRPPMPGESLKSFLLRLANLNACKYKVLVKHLGFRPNIWFTPGSASESMMYKALSKVLNVSEQALLEVLRTPSMKDLWKPNIKGTSEMKIRTVRACLSCLSEASYHRQAWQHAMYCVCTKHHERLIDCCPHCGNDLELGVCLNGRCQNCGSHRSDWPVQEMTVPVWQEEVFKGVQSRELLQSLLEMSMVAVRPLDLFTSDIRIREMKVSEVMGLMDSAWDLLHSQAIRFIIQSALSQRWSKAIGLLGKELPLTLYQTATLLALDEKPHGEVELCQSFFVNETRELDIVKSTKRFAILSHGQSADTLVKWTQLTATLGIKPIPLEFLKNAGVFTPVNPRAAKKDLLFDLDEVVEQICILCRGDRPADGYVAYQDLVPAACRYITGLSEGQVLVDIFRSELPVVFCPSQGGTLLDKLYVERKAFLRRYDESEIYTYKVVPESYLPAYFGTKRPNIEALLKSEFFQRLIDSFPLQDLHTIPTECLKHIKDNYLILNKWAYSHKKSKIKCLCLLKQEKIQPIVRFSEESCNSFEIFPKEAEQVLLNHYDELVPDNKKASRPKH